LPGGEGLIHDAHGACLLGNVAPGDVVSMRVDDRRRGMRRGHVIDVKRPGPGRIEAPCPVAGSCGGCSLQFVDPLLHAEIKSAWVQYAFRSVIEETSHWLPLPAGKADAPRRRLRWHVADAGDGRMLLGFKERASHAVVETAHCMVITPELEALRHGMGSLLRSDGYMGLESLQAIQLHDGIHAILELPDGASQPPLPQIDAGTLPLQWWWRCNGITRPLTRPVLQLHDRLPTVNGEIGLQIGPDDFIQGQEAGNRELIRQLLAWGAGARRVVDLFSGVGNLSLPLAAAGASVVGAEVVDASVRAANANAKRLQLDARYHQEDLFGRFDAAAYTGADLMIVDPPRKGAKRVCGLMHRLLPTRVIMVHCDVASGGRDAAIMQEQGYRLQALRPLDLFPWSGHVESLSLWAR